MLTESEVDGPAETGALVVGVAALSGATGAGEEAMEPIGDKLICLFPPDRFIGRGFAEFIASSEMAGRRPRETFTSVPRVLILRRWSRIRAKPCKQNLN